MKLIQPITTWANGQTVQATILNTYVIDDNLIGQAIFQYYLFDDNLSKVTFGQLTMTGEDYIKYETNQYAWDWVAAQLKLTIIGNYIPTTTTTTTETPITTTSTTTII